MHRRDLLCPVTYIDVDGTIVATTRSHKQGMDIFYKGSWEYAPLIVTLADTREVLFVVDRPGNVSSHHDAATWIVICQEDGTTRLPRPRDHRVAW
jgi:hypothetical protein